MTGHGGDEGAMGRGGIPNPRGGRLGGTFLEAGEEVLADKELDGTSGDLEDVGELNGTSGEGGTQ